MPISGTVSVEEIVLLLAALFGVCHHAWLLLHLSGYCATVARPADVILCRIYRRKEWARLGLKILLVYGACLMLTQPMPAGMDAVELGMLLLWRYGLVVVAIWLDVESLIGERDRRALGRLPLDGGAGP